jgi:rod shape-determining protein MreB
MALLSQSLWNPLIAVDLGTARTRVAWGDRPAVELPSMAEERPALRCGVVVDRKAAIAVLRTLMGHIARQFFSRPSAIACFPTDADDRERDAVIDCVTEAGAQAVYLVAEPFAAAVGAGADLSSPYSHMVMDIGEGTTDCAVIREGTIVAARAVRIGCGDLRDAVSDAILTEWGLSITPQAAEHLLQRIGVKEAADELDLATIIGIEVRTGRQIVFRIPTHGLRIALQPVVSAIAGCAAALFRDIPPVWGSEIIDTGLLLSGGGSLLRGMRGRIAAETRLTVTRVDDPLGAVVRGAREMLPVADLLQVWH